MKEFDYYDVDYCKYGFDCRRRTRIWTNLKSWKPRPLCNKDCNSMAGNRHKETSQRLPCKGRWDEQRKKTQDELYRVPEELIYDIISNLWYLVTKEGFSQSFQLKGSVSRCIVFDAFHVVVVFRPFAGCLFPIGVVASSLHEGSFSFISTYFLVFCSLLVRFTFTSMWFLSLCASLGVSVSFVDECLLLLYFFKTCGSILVHPALLNLTLSCIMFLSVLMKRSTTLACVLVMI